MAAVRPVRLVEALLAAVALGAAEAAARAAAGAPWLELAGQRRPKGGCGGEC